MHERIAGATLATKRRFVIRFAGGTVMLLAAAESLIWSPIATLFGTLFFFLYIFTPLGILFQQTRDRRLAHVPIDFTALPPEMSPFFIHAAVGLTEKRFEPLGQAHVHVGQTSQNCFVSCWVNRTRGEFAQIVGVQTPAPTSRLRIVMCATFQTEFTDGTTIMTSNYAGASCFPPRQTVDGVRCPGVANIGLLYELHKARVDRDRGVRTATLENMHDTSSRLQAEHEQEFDRLVALGYCRFDEANDRYLPTLKGAYLMTYRLLPPFKQILDRRKNQRADRTLRELGFGGSAAFRRMSQERENSNQIARPPE